MLLVDHRDLGDTYQVGQHDRQGRSQPVEERTGLLGDRATLLQHALDFGVVFLKLLAESGESPGPLLNRIR